MKITVNGEINNTDCATLAELLKVLKQENDKVATAVNGVFVPSTERDKTLLSNNDEIDIIAPMCGG